MMYVYSINVIKATVFGHNGNVEEKSRAVEKRVFHLVVVPYSLIGDIRIPKSMKY